MAPPSTLDATAPLAGFVSERTPCTAGAPLLPVRGRFLAHALLLVAAAGLWVEALGAVELGRIGDLGLVSALPPAALAALALVTASFAVALRHEHVSSALAVLHLVVLVAMLHGATGLIAAEPGSNVVWRHAGVTDYVLSTGTVDPHIDAYFNWPGFFFFTALATRASGLDGALGLSAWAPVAFELMYLPALVVITRAFTSERRLAWWAVWIFYLTNWVGQDYLAPQSLGYLLYLAVVAIVLRCLSRTAAPDLVQWRERGARLLLRLHARRPGIELREAATPAETEPGQRSALVLVCVVLIGAAVASHQLTPWMMLASLAALVGLRRCTARGLPVITLVLLVAWMTYLAAAYLDGHLKPLLGQTLDLHQAVVANVGGRLQGSPEHLLVVRIRLGMTALLWALALAGAVRGLRRGEASSSHAILALAPAGMVVLQPYGGEMLMRVYLFSLPFTACYAARALMPGPRLRGRWSAAVFATTAAVLIAGFLFTRYGNERATLFTSSDVQAVERLYDIAPHGSLLVAASPNVPWKQRHYADYRYQLLSRQLRITGPAPGPRRLAGLVARYMSSAEPARAYLLLTRSQRVYDEVLGSPPWGSSTAIQHAVERSREFVNVFDGRGGKIFVLRGAAKGGAR